jgi:hypothetical protein
MSRLHSDAQGAQSLRALGEAKTGEYPAMDLLGRLDERENQVR